MPNAGFSEPRYEELSRGRDLGLPYEKGLLALNSEEPIRSPTIWLVVRH